MPITERMSLFPSWGTETGEYAQRLNQITHRQSLFATHGFSEKSALLSHVFREAKDDILIFVSKPTALFLDYYEAHEAFHTFTQNNASLKMILPYGYLAYASSLFSEMNDFLTANPNRGDIRYQPKAELLDYAFLVSDDHGHIRHLSEPHDAWCVSSFHDKIQANYLRRKFNKAFDKLYPSS